MINHHDKTLSFIDYQTHLYYSNNVLKGDFKQHTCLLKSLCSINILMYQFIQGKIKLHHLSSPTDEGMRSIAFLKCVFTQITK